MVSIDKNVALGLHARKASSAVLCFCGYRMAGAVEFCSLKATALRVRQCKPCWSAARTLSGVVGYLRQVIVEAAALIASPGRTKPRNARL